MQVNKAFNCLGVLWALIELSERTEYHTKSNILEVLNYSIDERTVTTQIKYLEKRNVIKCDIPRTKRRGRSDIIFHSFCPQKIPKEVWNKDISRTTLWRTKTRLIEHEDGIGRYEKGLGVFDANRFFERAKPMDHTPFSFHNTIKKHIHLYDPEIASKWIKEDYKQQFFNISDGNEIILKPNDLKMFHIFLCWKVEKFYADT